MKRIHKSKDPILLAVLAEIHKTAEKPDTGYFTVKQWANKWGYSREHSARMIRLAVKNNILYRKDFRIFINSDLSKIPHYGKSKPLTKPKL